VTATLNCPPAGTQGRHRDSWQTEKVSLTCLGRRRIISPADCGRQKNSSHRVSGGWLSHLEAAQHFDGAGARTETHHRRCTIEVMIRRLRSIDIYSPTTPVHCHVVPHPQHHGRPCKVSALLCGKLHGSRPRQQPDDGRGTPPFYPTGPVARGTMGSSLSEPAATRPAGESCDGQCGIQRRRPRWHVRRQQAWVP